MIPTDPSSGRREANKERTRAAIEDAVFTLLSQHGLSAVTAQQVADAADISRRTFFNYFSSVEAVLADTGVRTIDDLTAMAAARPDDEPLFMTFDAVIAQGFDLRHLQSTSTVCRSARSDESTARHLASQQQRAAARMAEVLGERLSRRGHRPDALAIRVLSGALVATFVAAMDTWVERTGGEVSPATQTEFTTILRTAFTHLGSGFRALDPSPPGPA